jgi:hypothetical protein
LGIVVELVAIFPQSICLDIEKLRFNGCRTPKPPQQRRQPQRQLALDGCLALIISDHCGFKSLVILSILQGSDDGFGRQTMADRVAARPPFAFLGPWTGTLLRVPSVSLELAK